jgi:proline iminopeptidase
VAVGCAIDRTPFTAQTPSGAVVGWRSGSGPRALALHGGPGLSYDYLDGMVDELDGDFEVATFQQRGLAPSTEDGPFDVPTAVDDVVSVLDALGWESAWLVGHSYGGHLLLHVAVATPERCLGRLAVDTLGAVGDGGRSSAQGRFAAWRAAHPPDPDAAAVDPLAGGLAAIWPAYFGDPGSAPPMPPIRFSSESNEGLLADLTDRMPSLVDALGDVPCTIGFLAGEASPLPPGEASIATADRLGRAWVEVLEGTGHFPWLERPGSVRAAMLRLVTAATA